ncbi:MAG: glycerol-3-phosphate acyltransferase [Ignavibacteriaceae bacterium]|nr:glycerol-3-phosphate acyltransferase [Ignavibacteriaceae bacterium]
MNSFEVTNSKLIGISVFLIDFLKGLASTLIPVFLFPGEFVYPALSLLFAVFSHCYNPWINFKGGRGLATAAGGAAFMFPFLLIIWALLWVIFMVMRKNILLANISSTVLSLFVVYGSAALIIIFIKHIEPLKELIAEQKNNWKLKK